MRNRLDWQVQNRATKPLAGEILHLRDGRRRLPEGASLWRRRLGVMLSRE
jgi:hypothetical protein